MSRPRQTTAPRLTRVKPMMVRRSVDLPTPLRPSRARLPPAANYAIGAIYIAISVYVSYYMNTNYEELGTSRAGMSISSAV